MKELRLTVGKDKPKLFSQKDIESLQKLDMTEIAGGVYSVIYKNRSYEISIEACDDTGKNMSLKIDGKSTDVKVEDYMDILLEKMGIDSAASSKMTMLKAPMPGLIMEWSVKVGDEVNEGDKLLILEAMKMENVIKSVGSGKVKKVNFKVGDTVEKNEVLIEFE